MRLEHWPNSLEIGIDPRKGFLVDKDHTMRIPHGHRRASPDKLARTAALWRWQRQASSRNVFRSATVQWDLDSSLDVGDAPRPRQRGRNALRVEDRRPHVNTDSTVGEHPRPNVSCSGFDAQGTVTKGGGLVRTGGGVVAQINRVLGNTADTVATHLRLASVGVHNAHPKVSTTAYCWEQKNDPIRTNTPVSVAEPHGLRCIHLRPGALALIN